MGTLIFYGLNYTICDIEDGDSNKKEGVINCALGLWKNRKNVTNP